MRRLFFAAGTICTLVLMTGCATMMKSMMKIQQVPLVHSSLDMNEGKPHTVTVESSSLSEVVDRITVLGEKRSLVIVEKDCTETICELLYKRMDDAKSKTVGSTSVHGSGSSAQTTGSTKTYNLTFSSRIFVTLTQEDGKVAVEMVGVPTINEGLSCPPLLEGRGACTALPFNVQGENTPASSFKAQWGADISGKLEAELITGIFAELT